MITAELMTTATSTSSKGASLTEFITYSIENDSNLVFDGMTGPGRRTSIVIFR